jgi:hypothetical protein
MQTYGVMLGSGMSAERGVPIRVGGLARRRLSQLYFTSKAWNDVQRMRDAVANNEERDTTLKWTLWIPQVLLHAPSRGG